MQQQAPVEFGYSKKQIAMAMTAMFAVYGTMTYFVQFLPIARPKMVAELNGMSLYSLSVSLPALVSAFVTLIFGKFSDLFGRRFILMVSLSFALAGSILSAVSPNFTFLIVATAIGAVGAGSMMPLVFAVVGDVFAPDKRGKWIGLLNIPLFIFAVIGPTLGGLITERLNWRWIYRLSLPLVIFCLITVWMGVPATVQKRTKGKIDFLGCLQVVTGAAAIILGSFLYRDPHPWLSIQSIGFLAFLILFWVLFIWTRSKSKIDYLGCLLVLIAASTMIYGLSIAGTQYLWSSIDAIRLLAVSILFWILFVWSEFSAKEPVLDPKVFRNRIFLTVAGASLFSFFGQIGIFMYFPMFLQGVQSRTATLSGSIITPFSALSAAVGIPVGFLIARTKRFKWMYVLGFGLATIDMFGIVFFNEGTSIILIVLAATIIGVGLGAVPIINTLVIQNTMPQKLLGVAMGAIFFCIAMGTALAPAVLGSAMNSTSAQYLARSSPDELKRLDKATFDRLTDSKVLFNEKDMIALKQSFQEKWPEDKELLNKTVKAIRGSQEAGMSAAFLVGAVGMLISFLLICTIPKSSLADGVKEKEGEAVETSVLS
jgi:MFS family permease